MADKQAREDDHTYGDIPELDREGDRPTRPADKTKSRSTKNSKAAEKTTLPKGASGDKGARGDTDEDRARGKEDDVPGLSPSMEALLLKMHQNNQQMMQQMMMGLTGAVGDIKKSVEQIATTGAQDTTMSKKPARPTHTISEDEDSEEEEEEEEEADEKTDRENGKKEEETPEKKRDDEPEEEGQLGAEGEEDEADELITQIGSRFAKKEKHGHKINEKVAKLVLSGLEAKPVPEKIKEVADKCLPPENVPDLIAAEPSEEIKGIIVSEHSRRREKNFLNIPQDIIAGMQIMAQGMSTAYVAMKEGKKLEAKDVFKQMSDTFTMLADAHWSVTMRRRENIRPFMLQQYKQLCDEESEVPPSKYLFGRRVAKRMEAIDKVKRVQAKIQAVEEYPKKDFKEDKRDPKRTYKEWSDTSRFQGRFNKKPRN